MREQEPEETILLTQAEAGHLLRISRTTLYRLVQAGELQQINLGPRCARIRRESIDAFIRRKSSMTS